MSMASRVSAKLVYKPLKKDSNILLICEVRNSIVSAKEKHFFGGAFFLSNKMTAIMKEFIIRTLILSKITIDKRLSLY